MKSHITPFTRLAVVSLASLASLAFLGAGCSKKTQSDANSTMKGAYGDTKAVMGNTWDNVRSYSYDKRDDFTKGAKAMSSNMEAQMSEVRANYSEAKASATRKAAMADLKSAETDYKDKVDALGKATAATWDSAKQNVIAAWDRVQAAYLKARAD